MWHRYITCSPIHPFVHKSTNIQLYHITKEEIGAISKTIPANIPVLKGTRHLHQLIMETEGRFLRYRDISCFYGVKSSCEFCNCYDTHNFVFCATKEKIPDFLGLQENLHQHSSKIKLNVSNVYSSSSNSSELIDDEDSNVSIGTGKSQMQKPALKEITTGKFLLV